MLTFLPCPPGRSPGDWRHLSQACLWRAANGILQRVDHPGSLLPSCHLPSATAVFTSFFLLFRAQDKPAGHLSGKVHIIMSTPITSSRQHHSPPLSPVPTSPSDLPRKPLPPRPAPAGVVSSPISPGRQKLPDQQDSYTYPVIPLPQLPSLRDTTTHITTSLTATFTSAKQTIPSLMGWFGLEDTSPRPPSEEPHSAPLPGPQPLQQPPPQSREPLIDLGDDRDKGAPVERLMKSETIDDLLA